MVPNGCACCLMWSKLGNWPFAVIIQQAFGAQMPVLRSAGASLVVQWLRICLPMQGTRVRALVWEDPTCRGATRPVSHNY